MHTVNQGLLAAVLVTVSHPALAQQSPAPANSESAAAEAVSQSDTDADIVVTAQRRAQNLQDVPIAVTAVTGVQLQTQGIISTQQLNLVDPSVSMRVTSGAFQPYVRGVGTQSGNVENPVSLYIDGIYIPFQREGIRDLIDIERVEILKGPQGTLFGRNSTGGVIQILTKDPGQTFEGSADVTYANYDTLRANLYVAGPVSSNFATSLSVSYSKQADGWGRNLTTGNEIYKVFHSLSFRSKSIWDLTENTSAKFIADYITRRDNQGANFRPYRNLPLRLPGVIPSNNPWDASGAIDSSNRLKYGGASLTLNHDFGKVNLASISSYRQGRAGFDFDAVGVPTPAQLIYTTQPHETFSQELQLSSGAGSRITWTAGSYYFYSREGYDPLYVRLRGPLAPAPTSTAQITSSAVTKTESIAGYAQATVPLGAATNFTAGFRFTHEKRSLAGVQSGLLNNGVVIPALRPAVDTSTSVSRPTWRLSVDHKFSDDVMAFVSYNRGFKSGGYNVSDPYAASYSPERIDAYEIGLKTTPGRLRFNTSAFYYDYTSVQVVRYIAGISSTYNGGTAQIYGAEADLTASLFDGFNLAAGLQVLHAKFTRFPDAQFSVPIPTGGVTLLTGDASGNWLPFATPFQANGSADYTFDYGGGEIRLNVSGTYNDGYFTEPDNRITQGSFALVGASLGWTARDEKFNVKIFGNNLLNEAIITQGLTSTFGYLTAYNQAPRTYGVTFGVQF